MRLSRKILKTQYTDEFGGYSKTWFSDGLLEMKNQRNGDEEVDMVDNFDDQGDQEDNGMDGLARSLGLDIEALALELAMNDSTPPTQCLPVQMDNNTAGEPAASKEEAEKKTDFKDFT